jgi:hypothetical protein
VLEAFAAGCGGQMASTNVERLESGAAAFYGVRPGWSHLWRQAQIERREVYYIDNAFFDDAREERFRVGRNVVQMYEFPKLDYPSFRRPILPWREAGEHIVVCPQSNEFMICVERFTEQWTDWVTRRLRMYTTRPLIIRAKRDRRPLAEDLKGAWALVTHTSAAANEAIISGIPAFTTGLCAAASMSNHDLAQIERPRCPNGREQWASSVAAHEWTLDEMRDGTCWRALGA